MDIVTLGAALNGSAEYVNSHFKGGSNIQIVDNPDGTQTINASGEVSSEDTVARAEIAAIKDGENIDSFADVEAALGDKANADNVYKLALSDADLLPANTDLDNVKTVGCYYVLASATVSTITNRPTNNTSAFRLTVEFAAGEKRARQIYQEFNYFDKYIRCENSSNVFSEWKKVECDLSTKQGTISDLTTIRSGAALGATAVQPISGKGLSTNDYTNDEKTKLSGIAEGAEVNEIESIKVNNTTINPDANKVVNITVPTTAADVSALPDTTKYAAALSLTINSSTFVMTGQLKDQNGDNLGTAQTIDLPLESVVVGGSYNSQTKKVVLTLQNGNTIEFSVADLVSGLQTELSASNKLNPAYINYDSTHRAVSDTEKSTWNGKQNALSSTQLDAVNSGIDSTKVAQIETNKNNILYNTDNGVKNVVNFNTNLPTTTIKGITFTDNHNNTINVDGTSTDADVYVQLYNVNSDNLFGFKIGETVVITSTSNTVALQIIPKRTGGYGATVFGTKLSPAIYTIPSNFTGFLLRVGVIATGTHVDNEDVSGMICLKSLYDADPTYQPYAMSNAELTAAIQAIQAQLANQ